MPARREDGLLSVTKSETPFAQTTPTTEAYGGQSADVTLSSIASRICDPPTGTFAFFEGYRSYTYVGVLDFIVLLGVVGNLLTFLLFMRKQYRKNSSTIYLQVSAISNSMMLMCTSLHGTFYLSNGWFLTDESRTLCQTWIALQIFGRQISAWMSLGLSADRMVGIVYPIRKNQLCTTFKARIMCLAVVLLLAAVCFTEVGLWTIPSYNITMYTPVFGVCEAIIPMQITIYNMALALFLLVPVASILIVNAITIVSLRRAQIRRAQIAVIDNSAKKPSVEKASKTLVFTCIMAFLTIAPFAGLEAIRLHVVFTGAAENSFMSSEEHTALYSAYRIATLVLLINYGQTFYVLMASSQEYRKKLRKMMTCK